jgi:hypothetical protein
MVAIAGVVGRLFLFAYKFRRSLNVPNNADQLQENFPVQFHVPYSISPQCTELPLETRRALVRWPPLQGFVFYAVFRVIKRFSNCPILPLAEHYPRYCPLICHREARCVSAFLFQFFHFSNYVNSFLPLTRFTKPCTRHSQPLPRYPLFWSPAFQGQQLAATLRKPVVC